jgi:hypothetical protein
MIVVIDEREPGASARRLMRGGNRGSLSADCEGSIQVNGVAVRKLYKLLHAGDAAFRNNGMERPRLGGT